jgi:hypothetical protein
MPFWLKSKLDILYAFYPSKGFVLINKVMRLALRGFLIDKKALLRILILTILFTSAGTFVLWDYSRVNRDFSELKTLLRDARYRAITKNKILIARFIGNDVVITDKNTGTVAERLNIPTLSKVNYDTTLGDNMIVFTGHGTSEYNKRVHGGDLRLK